MPKQIPDGWKTLNVSEVFAIRGSYPRDLRIFRKPDKSPNIYARFLPLPTEDPRPNQGRTKGGKRLTVDASMETTDPKQAAKDAVNWVQRKTKEFREALDKSDGKPFKSLSDYWDVYFPDECQKREVDRGFTKWKREELRKWNADVYGIKNQLWAKKSCDLITPSDYKDYFSLLEKQAKKNRGTNGSGIKADAKTLINKLLGLASEDFLGHQFPSFPTIKKQKRQVTHIRLEDWEMLLKTVNDLSAGAARKTLTVKQYNELDFRSGNRINQRNWVDLYDALLLEWFFYLRSEDMKRLRVEWFKKSGTKKVICNLQEVKGNRGIHETEHYRPDAVPFWTRLKARRPKNGWLVTPHIKMQNESGAENGVRDLLNYLLKNAIKTADLELPVGACSWTTIRHTAFRLTLEEFPTFGQTGSIKKFAFNGHTSEQMLRETYLNYIENDQLGDIARETIKAGKYTMVRMVNASDK